MEERVKIPGDLSFAIAFMVSLALNVKNAKTVAFQIVAGTEESVTMV